MYVKSCLIFFTPAQVIFQSLAAAPKQNMAGKRMPDFDMHVIMNTHTQKEEEEDLKVTSEYTMFNAQGLDFACFLTYHITFTALLVAASLLSGLQLIGDPIECWCPAQFSNAMCNYTKSICWISKQYVIDFDTDIPSDEVLKEQASRRDVNYYPFVPFILLSLAVILCLPHFLYNFLQEDAGVTTHSLLQIAASPGLDNSERINEVSRAMHFYLRNLYDKRHPEQREISSAQGKLSGRTGPSQRSTRTSGLHEERLPSSLAHSSKQFLTGCLFFFWGSGLGTYNTGLYLLTRLVTLGLIVGAFPALSFVLKDDFTLWGWTLFQRKVFNVDLTGVSDVTEEEREFYFFPRETLCDFKVRQMQNVHSYTVQCVLPINMWTEKVFLVLWYWLVVLILVNLYNYQYSFRKLLLPSSRWAFVKKHLTIAGVKVKLEQKAVGRFICGFLSPDSVLDLRTLESTAGNHFVCEVVLRLFYDYKQFEANQRKRLSVGEQLQL